MFLHYLNTAVSECMHLQHEEFVPYTFFFFLLFDQFMCINLKQLAALFRKLGLFSSLIHIKSCVLSLTCLCHALKRTVFLYSNSIQSISMKIQELHLFSEPFTHSVTLQILFSNNIGWFFINSVLVILVPVEKSCFLSAL